MEEKFKFFDDKYNKILDLIEQADSKLANKYKEVMFALPDAVLDRLDNGGKFKLFAKDFQSDLNFDGEMLEFDFTKYGSKYFDVALRMYPLFEEEFCDEFDEAFEEMTGFDLSEMNQWFMFSLTISNVKGVAKLRINYEEKDGKLVYKGEEINGVEIDYQVFLEKRDDKYFVIITKYLNGHELYQKEVSISYENLLTYSASCDDENCEISDDELEEEF